MDKQTIEQAANVYFQIQNATHNEWEDIPAAFIAGAEFATPKWIPVSEDIPQYTKALVIADSGYIFSDSYIDGKFDTASRYYYTLTHYLPIDSLPKP